MAGWFRLGARVLFVFLLTLPLRAQTGVAQPELTGVDDAVLAFMKKWDIPGGAVAITKDGRLVYARGFGYADAENKVPVMPSSRFRIASVSKPFTAIAIMKLVEEGRLKLDDIVFGPKGILNDPIYSDIKDPRTKTITLRNLLQHRGGWDRYATPDPMFQSQAVATEARCPLPPPASAIIQYALRRPLDFTPGTRAAYSNFGYCILGRVIEKVTGQTYEQYVKMAEIDPLGITEMAIGSGPRSGRMKDEVVYYDDPANVGPSIFEPGTTGPMAYGYLNLRAMDSHGGWVATATDLVRWMNAVDGFGRKDSLVSRATLESMTPKPPAIPLCWEVNKAGNWWHDGCMPGTCSELVRTADGMTWALLFNALGPVTGDKKVQERRPIGAIMSDLDRIVWNGLAHVRQWPSHDQFLDDPRAIGL